MSNPPRKFNNPIELALSKSHVVPETATGDRRLERTTDEERALAELDAAGEVLGFFGRYFVESAQAFAIPASFEADQPVPVINFGGLTFQGNLETHSVVKINSLYVSWMESINVRALCLMFDNVLMLPSFETLDENRLLFVPAASIDDMQRVEINS